MSSTFLGICNVPIAQWLVFQLVQQCWSFLQVYCSFLEVFLQVYCSFLELKCSFVLLQCSILELQCNLRFLRVVFSSVVSRVVAWFPVVQFLELCSFLELQRSFFQCSFQNCSVVSCSVVSRVLQFSRVVVQFPVVQFLEFCSFLELQCSVLQCIKGYGLFLFRLVTIQVLLASFNCVEDACFHANVSLSIQLILRQVA